MRTQAQAPIQFVKSPLISANYPAVSIQSKEDELYNMMLFVENMFPQVAIIVCQRAESPSVQYVNENCRKVLGYDPAHIKKMTLADFLALIHPEDIQEVQQCFGFINASEPYDPVDYRFELHYRIMHKCGYYIPVTDTKMAIQYKGSQYIYINCIRDVTAEAKFHDVNMNIYQNIKGDFRKIQTYIPRQGQSDFTPRQMDIVNLMDKGFTNQEIAHRLSVSVNTIKNHKSLLFRKTRVRNTIELLRLTRGLV